MPIIQRADPVARRRAVLALVAVVVVAIAGYVALDTWLVGLRERDPAEARRALATALTWVTVALSALLIALGAYAWQLGGRTRRSLRFPPPGVPVVKDTLVLEGKEARTRGALIRIIAGGLIALSIGRLSLAFQLAARLA